MEQAPAMLQPKIVFELGPAAVTRWRVITGSQRRTIGLHGRQKGSSASGRCRAVRLSGERGCVVESVRHNHSTILPLRGDDAQRLEPLQAERAGLLGHLLRR